MKTNLDAEIAALLARERKLKRIAAIRQRISKIERSLGRHSIAADKSLRVIGDIVSMAFGTDWDAILSKSKLDAIVHPRQVICYIAQRLRVAELNDIGHAMRQHHGTVRYSYRQTLNRISTEPKFKAKVQQIEEQCRVALEADGLLS